MIYVRRVFHNFARQLTRVLFVRYLSVKILIQLPRQFINILTVRHVNAYVRRIQVTIIRQLTTATSATTKADRSFGCVVLIIPITSILRRVTYVTRAINSTCFRFGTIRISNNTTCANRSTRLLGICVVRHPSHVSFMSKTRSYLRRTTNDTRSGTYAH